MPVEEVMLNQGALVLEWRARTISHEEVFRPMVAGHPDQLCWMLPVDPPSLSPQHQRSQQQCHQQCERDDIGSGL